MCSIEPHHMNRCLVRKSVIFKFESILKKKTTKKIFENITNQNTIFKCGLCMYTDTDMKSIKTSKS